MKKLSGPLSSEIPRGAITIRQSPSLSFCGNEAFFSSKDSALRTQRSSEELSF